MSLSTRNHLAVALALLCALSFVAFAHAQESAVTFPVDELGGCENKAECKTYCDEPGHFKACFAFAKEHKLLPEEAQNKSDEEIEKFAEIMEQGGPGGCTSPNECRLYCDSTEHMDECISFGEEHGMMSGDDLEEAKKVRDVVRRGGKLPGGCTNRDSCEAYCADPAHGDTCTAFAIDAGFLKPEEAEIAKKSLELMASGETPGGCRGHKECEAYCRDEGHGTECRAFGEKLGIQPPEGMRGPGGGFQGPGGCTDPESCKAFCSGENHEEECSQFSPQEEGDFRGRSDGVRRDPPESHQAVPTQVLSCLKERAGGSIIEKLMRGSRPDSSTEPLLRDCFETVRGESAPPGERSDARGGEDRRDMREDSFRREDEEGMRRQIEFTNGPRPEGLPPQEFREFRQDFEGENSLPHEGVPPRQRVEDHSDRSVPPQGSPEGFPVPPRGSVPEDFRPQGGLMPPPQTPEPPREFSVPPSASIESQPPPPPPDAPQSFLKRGTRALIGAVISR